MDSISQFVLGAAVGEVVLGKKIGNKALLWGALAGTLPDLDILFTPFLDQITKIAFHRGISHSFFGICIAAPIIAWLVHKWYKGELASYYDWFKLFFWGMITHPMLDTFTTYGTQLWQPFSDSREALCSIFVADPIYTVPLILSFILIWRMNRQSKLRRMVNFAALGFSTLYLLFTVFNHSRVIDAITETAVAKSLDYKRIFASPTPLNNVLWFGLAEVEDGYHMGQYSVFDSQPTIDLEFHPRNEHLLDEVDDKKMIEVLRWFSDGYYVVSKKDDTVIFHDIRFGKAGGVGTGQPSQFVFNFHMKKEENGKWSVDEVIPRDEFGSIGDLFRLIISRAKGN